MTFFPHLEIKTADSPLTVIPPKFLKGLTYKSSVNGLSTFEFNAVDPTFDRIERLLIESDDSDNPIFCRFGYQNSIGELRGRNWMRARLINFIPNITTRGTEINATAMIDAVKGVGVIEPQVFSGKISTVIRKIADKLGVIAEVEETNDDENEALKDNNGEPRIWSTRNLPLMVWVRKELLPLAQSKSSTSGYHCWISDSLDDKPILHFHTKEYEGCSRRVQEPLELTYLVGRQGEVLDFQPNYSGKYLGMLGAGQIVNKIYDPPTKTYTEEVHNLAVNKDSKNFGTGTKTTSVPSKPEDPTSTKVSQGVLYSRELLLTEASAKGRSSWEISKEASFSAALTLVGLPKLVYLDANDFVNIHVIMPTIYTGRWDQHWSSGLYRITECIHQVESSYSISCQLLRDTAPVGSAPAY